MNYPRTENSSATAITFDDLEWRHPNGTPVEPVYQLADPPYTETVAYKIDLTLAGWPKKLEPPRRWLTFPACALVRMVRAAMRGLYRLDRLIVRVAIREGFVTDVPPRETPEES